MNIENAIQELRVALGETTVSTKNHHDAYKVQWNNYLQLLIR